MKNFLQNSSSKTPDETGKTIKQKALTCEEFVRILEQDLETHRKELESLHSLQEVDMPRIHLGKPIKITKEDS